MLFRNAENLDIGECTKTLSLLNVLMLRYLRKVLRICGKFLADMLNNQPNMLCCDWNFPPRVKHGEQLAYGCIYGVRRRETTPSLAAL